jgi:predicted adenine nucleotide alpha hydrolase (AANH) superfamily ATPase/VanZ family protein
MKRELIIFILLCWLVAVLSLLWSPSVYVPQAVHRITYYDKFAHAAFFGVMTYLIIAVGLTWKELKFRHVAFFAFTLVTLINMTGEYVQGFIPGRDPSYFDFLAGLTGTLIAIPLAYMIHHSPRQKMLLHVCCAPCTTAVADLLKSGYKLELYYFNPNIHPENEYEKRLEEVRRLAKHFDVKLHIGEYDHDNWLQEIKGHEDQPEGGSRCELCFAHRLKEAAELCSRRNIPIFGTTLSISPHKDSYLINKTGLDVVVDTGQAFLVYDFKQDDGYKKSLKLSKKFGFYRQKYCGCEFSLRDTKQTVKSA